MHLSGRWSLAVQSESDGQLDVWSLLNNCGQGLVSCLVWLCYWQTQYHTKFKKCQPVSNFSSATMNAEDPLATHTHTHALVPCYISSLLPWFFFFLSMMWTHALLSNTLDGAPCACTLGEVHSHHQFLSLHASRLSILSRPATLSCHPISYELPNLKEPSLSLSSGVNHNECVSSVRLLNPPPPPLSIQSKCKDQAPPLTSGSPLLWLDNWDSGSQSQSWTHSTHASKLMDWHCFMYLETLWTICTPVLWLHAVYAMLMIV